MKGIPKNKFQPNELPEFSNCQLAKENNPHPPPPPKTIIIKITQLLCKIVPWLRLSHTHTQKKELILTYRRRNFRVKLSGEDVFYKNLLEYEYELWKSKNGEWGNSSCCRPLQGDLDLHRERERLREREMH